MTVDGDTVKIEAVGRDEWALGHHALSSGRYTWKVRVELSTGMCVSIKNVESIYVRVCVLD